MIINCRSLFSTLIQVCLFLPCNAQSGNTILALHDVNIIDVLSGSVNKNQNVLITNSIITRVGNTTDLEIPAGYQQIECTGKYLMPGLADMHVHVFDSSELLMYLINGVTTVRNLHGIAMHLQWKKDIEEERLLGPHFYSSGPILEQAPLSRSTNTTLTSIDKIDSIVFNHKRLGYDFIKIYDNVSLPFYEQLILSARKYSIPVAGHIPTPVGIGNVIKINGQKSIEHLEELLPFFNDGRDTTNLIIYATELAQSNSWVTATAVVYESAFLQTVHDWSWFEQSAGFRFMSRETIRDWGWEQTFKKRNQNSVGIERYTRTLNFFTTQLLPAFKKAGVKLLIGTDAPVPMLVPGYSLINEMQLFKKAGFSNAEILKIATVNSAKFLNSNGGYIAEGMNADLVLLNQNPLEDLEAFRRIEGIIFKGSWYSSGFLASLLSSKKE
ncbi:MAG: amidohydrolase [Chitinophagaceae bacterium]|nr:amidohydrolase [Chitinophagaceae bacterium]